MKIDCIRIYSEVLEQGVDFKEYLFNAGYKGSCINIYAKKERGTFVETDSLTDRIRKCKDVDVFITAISDDAEYPILMVEYSTAVPTDDHKMQRADTYFWSAIFKVPLLKISPINKGMEQNFGGGKKFSEELEMVLSYRFGALFYSVPWENIEGIDALETKSGALSCIPYNEKLKDIITDILDEFVGCLSYDEYFEKLKLNYSQKYNDIISKYENDNLRSVIVDSSRFKWKSTSLISKINRFGHAMDPDRGILFFTNMLVGVENCQTEIQINRNAEFNSRCGYKSLFDSAPNEEILTNFIKGIIEKNENIFTAADALFILQQALNIKDYQLFEKVTENKYIISNEKLKYFLFKCSSMVAKSIFFLSTKLILTDKNRVPICEIIWDRKSIDEFLLDINVKNYTLTTIEPLTTRQAKEDIITYASVELYKKINCELLAVSYPGAQGDRCLLQGAGRNVLREYVDIIAYDITQTATTVYLEECKDNISKSTNDVKKLKDIVNSNEKRRSLECLLEKVTNIPNIKDVKISIGSKVSRKMPSFDVDYIFMFEIDDSDDDKTVINYTVAIIDTKLLDKFKPLINEDGRIKGSFSMDKIYIIS